MKIDDICTHVMKGDKGPLGDRGYVIAAIANFEDLVIKESTIEENKYSIFISKISRMITITEDSVDLKRLEEENLIDLMPRRSNITIDKNNLIIENYMEKIIILDFMSKNNILNLNRIIIDKQI